MFFNFEREETNTKITTPYYEVIYLDDYNCYEMYEDVYAETGETCYHQMYVINDRMKSFEENWKRQKAAIDRCSRLLR